MLTKANAAKVKLQRKLKHPKDIPEERNRE
jgi:hypothetical protein